MPNEQRSDLLFEKLVRAFSLMAAVGDWSSAIILQLQIVRKRGEQAVRHQMTSARPRRHMEMRLVMTAVIIWQAELTDRFTGGHLFGGNGRQ